MISKLRQYLRDASGHAAIIFALGSIPLLVAAGAAIDASRANRAAAELQTVADSAALAISRMDMSGSSATDAEMQAVVQNLLAANGTGQAVDEVKSVDINRNVGSGVITVGIKAGVKTTLMKLAGFSELEIAASADAVIDSQHIEIALVLDNTLSMQGQRFANLKIAAHGLVSDITDNASNKSKLTMSLVPFARYVNVGLGNRNAAWMDVPNDTGSDVWYGCAGHRGGALNTSINGSAAYPGMLEPSGGQNDCPGPVIPLTGNTTQIQKGIDEMFLAGGTFLPGGLLWGWHTLADEPPFTEALSKVAREQKGGRRIMVLLTDGMNSVTTDPASPVRDGEPHLEVDQMTLELCTAVKQDGIEIYTVAFEVRSEAMKDLLVECASRPGMAYDAADADSLRVAFNEIARNLAVVYLSR
jgi:Flp pilus assembly protein TadG